MNPHRQRRPRNSKRLKRPSRINPELLAAAPTLGMSANLVHEVVTLPTDFLATSQLKEQLRARGLAINIGRLGVSLLRPRDARLLATYYPWEKIQSDMRILAAGMKGEFYCTIGTVALTGTPPHQKGLRYVSLLFSGEGAARLQAERRTVLEHFNLRSHDCSTPQLSLFRTKDIAEAEKFAQPVREALSTAATADFLLAPPTVAPIRFHPDP